MTSSPSQGEEGRTDLIALVADLRRRLDTFEDYVCDLPQDSVDLQMVRSIWQRRGPVWHWHGEEPETLRAFVNQLIKYENCDAAQVLDRYLDEWHQTTWFDSDEVLPPE